MQKVALLMESSLILLLVPVLCQSPVMLHRGFEPAACFDIWLVAFHIIEQLYDTPFPTEPQNDLPSKKERNAEIRARYEQGETVGDDYIVRTLAANEPNVNDKLHN